MRRIFGVTPNELVPTADPEDIAAAWNVYEGLAQTHRGQLIGVDIGAFERVCKPGADVGAVVYRTMMLRLIMEHRHEVFPEWADCRPKDEDLFRAAAIAHMEWIQTGIERTGIPVDQDEFLRVARGQAA